MKHKIFSLIILFLSASAVLTAQEKIQVSGKVSDKAGLPLEGVALVETGSATNGVMTDSLGRPSPCLSRPSSRFHAWATRV